MNPYKILGGTVFSAIIIAIVGAVILAGGWKGALAVLLGILGAFVINWALGVYFTEKWWPFD